MKDEKDSSTTDMFAAEPEKRGKGRPRQHADQAAKQKAYRERLKAEGKRVITHVVADMRDTEKPLTSDIIDLSAVRRR
jgi:hypothetical protein